MNIFGSSAGYQFVSLWQVKGYVSKYIVLCPKHVKLNQNKTRVNFGYRSHLLQRAIDRLRGQHPSPS